MVGAVHIGAPANVIKLVTRLQNPMPMQLRSTSFGMKITLTTEQNQRWEETCCLQRKRVRRNRGRPSKWWGKITYLRGLCNKDRTRQLQQRAQSRLSTSAAFSTNPGRTSSGRAHVSVSLLAPTLLPAYSHEQYQMNTWSEGNSSYALLHCL